MNGHGQRNIFRSMQSAEKLLEKYTALAKEALSAGDKTLSENYLQHADHFMRVVEDKNKNRIQSKPENIPADNKINFSQDSSPSVNQNLEKDNNKNSE